MYVDMPATAATEKTKVKRTSEHTRTCYTVITVIFEKEKMRAKEGEKEDGVYE